MTFGKRFTRSRAGDVLNIIVLVLVAAFMAFPLIFAVSNAFKPVEELFVFPPRLIVKNPSLVNFRNLSIMMRESTVPLSRNFFNSVFITVIGVGGQVILASLTAYVLSKHDFYGRRFLMEVVITSLMFTGSVIMIPSYIIVTKLHLINTHFSIILPAFCSSMGLFLMKQFIDSGIPDVLLEAAKIDGAGEMKMFFGIVMPLCKPAWLTLFIFSFQTLWNSDGGAYIFDDELKLLPSALSNISNSGAVARAGVSGAVSLIMLIPPIVTFLITQSNVLETMASSGIKD